MRVEPNHATLREILFLYSVESLEAPCIDPEKPARRVSRGNQWVTTAGRPKLTGSNPPPPLGHSPCLDAKV